MSMHRLRGRTLRITIWLALVAIALPVGATARSNHFGDWQTATKIEEVSSAQADGCPIESRDGRKLYIASTRPGAVGGPTDPNDIWVASRPNRHSAWSTPVHLPEPVNSAAADFCPTPVGRSQLYFVSARTHANGCGAGDIYRTEESRRRPAGRTRPTSVASRPEPARTSPVASSARRSCAPVA